MKRVLAAFCLVGLLGTSSGCGSDKKEDKQPKLSGDADPKIKGPASPGVGGGKGGTKPGAGVD